MARCQSSVAGKPGRTRFAGKDVSTANTIEATSIQSQEKYKGRLQQLFPDVKLIDAILLKPGK